MGHKWPPLHRGGHFIYQAKAEGVTLRLRKIAIRPARHAIQSKK